MRYLALLFLTLCVALNSVGGESEQKQISKETPDRAAISLYQSAKTEDRIHAAGVIATAPWYISVETAEKVIPVLAKDPVASVRMAALEAIEGMSNVGVVTAFLPLVKTMLKDGNPDVRLGAKVLLELLNEKLERERPKGK